MLQVRLYVWSSTHKVSKRDFFQGDCFVDACDSDFIVLWADQVDPQVAHQKQTVVGYNSEPVGTVLVMYSQGQ